MPYTSTDQMLPKRLLKFYRCGICDCYHPLQWDGDCREDAARFFADDLDTQYGYNGWEEVPMPGGEEE
jgi:hypothetical protein